MKNVHLVTVNYKQEQYLTRMLQSMSIPSNVKLSIVVVDNSGELSAEKMPESVRLVGRGINEGYIKGLSLGFRSLRASSDDIVIFCNPDLEFKHDFFKVLIENENEVTNAIIAPSIVDSTGTNQNPNMLCKPGFLRRVLFDIEFSSYYCFIALRMLKSKLRKAITKKTVTYDEKQDIYLPHGSCMVAKYGFIKSNRILEHEVFLWGEEVFIANSARRAGGKVVFLPSLRVFHDLNSSTKFIVGRERYNIWKSSYAKYREIFNQ